MIGPWVLAFLFVSFLPLSYATTTVAPCTCSTSEQTSCEQYCTNKNLQFVSVTCYPEGGVEGYCKCYGTTSQGTGYTSYGISPGSQCE